MSDDDGKIARLPGWVGRKRHLRQRRREQGFAIEEVTGPLPAMHELQELHD